MEAPNPMPSRIDDSMWWLWLRLQELEPTDGALGGIAANKSGYHNTRAANDARWPGNYSVRDAIDRRGPADKAAAIDWTFRSAQRGDYRTIAKYHARFMAAAKAKDPRLDGWREAYGQADSDRQVEGWDCRYDKAVSSDDSHLWHIHFSETRAYVTSLDNKKCLLSVLKGETLKQYLDAGGKLAVAPTPKPTPQPLPQYDLGDRILRQSMRGSDVAELQKLLNLRGAKLATDGDFGPKTYTAVRNFQGARWLPVDGLVGPDTLGALRTDLGRRILKRGMNGSDVGELQRLLNRRGAKLRVDHDFGPNTEAAVRAFQRSRRLSVDGQAGPKTVGALRA